MPGDEKPAKLSKEVHARLKQAIFDFRMPPGQRYSEATLADMLAVSRTPLRLALHILEHEGYLCNVGGHNCWQVRPLDLSHYEDLYDFRAELEALALRMAQAAGSLRPLPALSDFWEVDAAARNLDPETVRKQDERFHLAIVGLSGNQSLVRTFAEITDRIRIIRRLDFVSEKRINAAYDEHATILKALSSGDADAAAHLIKRHIETSREEIRQLTLHNISLATMTSEIS